MNVDAIHTDNSTALHTAAMAVRAPATGAFDAAENPASGVHNQRLIWAWNGQTAIRHIYPHALFNKSPLQLRRIGALGGKAHGRNERARRALMPPPPPATPLAGAARQSTAEAVAALDARFPWLCGAEKRRSRKLPSTQLKCGMYRIAG